MKRIKLTIAYDGTAYSGWQRQDNAVTVEGSVSEALKKLTGEELELIGASRTDAGVHAAANVAVFDTEATIPPERYAVALNSYLPDDIRIMSSEEVPEDFHPRYDAVRKRYEYHLLTAKVCPPLSYRYAHHIKENPDIAAMNRAASYLIGPHDFTSFCAAGAQVKSKVRTLYSLSVYREGDEIIISVEGDGFLYNMVRILAGTLLQAGLGRIKPEEAAHILAARDRTKAGPTLPAKGLCLCEIEY